MTTKLNTDNGLQRQTTEGLLLTAVWRNGGCSASYDSFVVGSSAVLRLNFCAKNPPLRQAAKRISTTRIIYNRMCICSSLGLKDAIVEEKIILYLWYRIF